MKKSIGRIFFGSEKTLLKNNMFEQQYAMTMLILMTISNLIFAVFMIFEFLPVEYGMPLAFFCMYLMIWKTKRDLMGNEKLWENSYRKNKTD